MRIPTFAVVLAALAAFMAACGDDDGGGDQAADRSETASETSSETASETPEVDLDEGVAAVVQGEEISVASVDEHVDAFAQSPQIAEQLEGQDGEAARSQLRAQVLSTTIVTRIVEASAEELGRPVTEEDIAETRTELENQVGGADALDSALEEQGYTASLLDLELTGLAGMSNVQEALDEQAGDDGSGGGETGTEGGVSPSQQRAQDFLREELTAADVRVDEDFGTWRAETGQVVPPGATAGSSGGG